MIFAKFIDCPINTQVPSVRKPESTTGASVKATSRALRSTASNNPLINTNANILASINAPAIVPAALA